MIDAHVDSVDAWDIPQHMDSSTDLSRRHFSDMSTVDMGLLELLDGIWQCRCAPHDETGTETECFVRVGSLVLDEHGVDASEGWRGDVSDAGVARDDSALLVTGGGFAVSGSGLGLPNVEQEEL